MHLQRNATQRNATQRNAYHHYLLKNNFKFYISKFFKAVNFLSAVFGFAKISSFIKEKQNLCSFFYREKRTTPKADSRQKSTSFCQKEDKAKARFQRKTTPFRIRNSLVKTFSQYLESPSFAEGVLWERGDSRSNLFSVDCHDFLRSLAMTIKNNFAIFNYAFSFDAFNFEIISRNENYAFDYNKYFCRNGNNRIGGRLPRLLTKSRNDEFVGCNYGFIARKNDLFSRNDYGGKFIFGFWNNFNSGFLFNRKILKTKI